MHKLSKTRKPTENLEAIAEEAHHSLSARDAARENTLRLCRKVIRHSANAIRAIHRQEKTNAEQLLDSAHVFLKQLNHDIPDEHSDLRYAGFVHDAQKEFAEASITLSIVNTTPLPDPKTLGITYPAYLNGMGEAVGELRRYLLDGLRHNDLSRCEELLEAMDDIYSTLVTMDYPDVITHGLRRTTDAVRGILEKTRGELTLVLRQKELEDKLEQRK